jgi:hypothetical protein
MSEAIQGYITQDHARMEGVLPWSAQVPGRRIWELPFARMYMVAMLLRLHLWHTNTCFGVLNGAYRLMCQVHR